MKVDSRQLQAKFKHATDFGVTGSYTPTTAAQYEAAIHSHILSPVTQAIRGTYRGKNVVHYLNVVTQLDVIADTGDTYVSGWKLSAAQMANLRERGAL